jgi:SAM-dependent methyltransferase
LTLECYFTFQKCKTILPIEEGENMNCPICEGSKWKNVDRYRTKPQDMEMCESCGMVSYPKRHKNPEQVREYYRNDYRGGAPQVNNLFTGTNKLHYHADFLGDQIQEWSTEGKKDPVISDVGGAYGMFLNWWSTLKNPETGEQLFPDADLNGVELTKSYRRVAYHEYGLDLKEDFDESKKYDLITSYKVLEHQFDPQVELERYKKCLKPGGRLYLGIPVWFEKLHNFGGAGWDLEYYYHPDHVNVWGKPHIEHLIRKSGFKIIKENHWTYDSVYMLEVGEETDRPAMELPTAEKVESILARIQQADEALAKKDYKRAVQLWPRFPVARRAIYEYARADLHKEGKTPEGAYKLIKDKVVDPWVKMENGLCADAVAFAGDIACRYDKFEDGCEAFQKLLQIRPGCQEGYSGLANLHRAAVKKAPTEEKRVELISKALQITQLLKNTNMSAFAQGVTWCYNDMANLPMPGE